MAKNIQILVSDPCSASWENMQPSGNGRHCTSCLKTIVDFSTMSDRELLSWLADKNKSICGRFAPDQLNRNLIPTVKRNRSAWSAWNFLLAGLLLSGKISAQTKPATARMSQIYRRPLPLAKMSTVPTDYLPIPLSGDVRIEADSPKYTTLAPVVVQGFSATRCSYVLGGASTTIVTRWDTVTVLKDFLKDTLAYAGLIKKEPTLYPNPAVRGSAVRLSLSSNITGDYKLQLFNGGGSLLQERQIAWMTASQTELLSLPASLSAGVYFIKLTHAGTGKVYTRRLVVL